MRKSRWGNEFNCNYAKIKTKQQKKMERKDKGNPESNTVLLPTQHAGQKL